jgi:hypothetical protein
LKRLYTLTLLLGRGWTLSHVPFKSDYEGHGP